MGMLNKILIMIIDSNSDSSSNSNSILPVLRDLHILKLKDPRFGVWRREPLGEASAPPGTWPRFPSNIGIITLITFVMSSNITISIADRC